jgi:FtsP/CotA-like multicopper oxidase with cupredoxin domain
MTPDILDNRISGVPDPTMRGPAMIQIGTEGGLLPAPVLLPNTPVGYEQNKRNIVVLNVLEKTLFMGPAERADVIIDFTPFAGKTIILYNDAPAPVPAGDPRYDFYTGNPDYSATGGANNQGGAPSTRPGYGPNTRTIMQFRVAGVDAAPGAPGPVDYYNPATLTALQNATTGLPAIFKAGLDAPIVPESAYNAIGYTGGATTDTYARIQDHYLTFTPYGSTTPRTMAMKNKAIQELFDPEGRMNATLGVELPFTGALIQTTVPLGFTDPPTEIWAPNETQLWKITHNGVDTHPIHFHLVNVQVINRVGWDGAIRPPDENELGWKETVRMNPLEDIIVAMKAKVPTFPFSVPDSIRPHNVAMPVGSTFASLDPTTGAPITVTNSMTNFGHEYTWHCHILGHEENDMMRPGIFNANAKTELLWRNPTTGEDYVWYMDGVSMTGSAQFTTVAAPWQIVATGDFNNDGKRDLLWRNPTTGENYVWYMDGTTFLGSAQLFTVAAPWQVVGTGDFNGDGKPDILWRNPTSGENWVWYMNGVTFLGSVQLFTVASPWQITGTGDFNGDGKPDILWRNPTTGENYVWYMNGVTFLGSAQLPTLNDANMSIVGVGDFNSDVWPDILWRNTATGENTVWYMNQASQIGTGTIPAAALPWQIVGR